jgi:Uma2 family endonuclease
MSAASQPITLDDFLARPEREDGLREELIEGEIVLSPGPKPLHAQIIRKLREALMPLEAQGYVVAGDFSVMLTPQSMPWPDLGVVNQEAWDDAIRRDSYTTGSPALVIEVRSPSNRRLGQKATLYLENGAEAVWIVNPKRRTVVVYDNEGVREARENEQVAFRGVIIEVDRIFG